MNDFDKALDTLKQMLSTDEGQKSLKSIAGMMSGGDEYTPAVQSQPSDTTPPDISHIASSFHAMQTKGAPRHSLLSALRPYLSTKRQGKFDVALRILQITQLTSFTKNAPPKE